MKSLPRIASELYLKPWHLAASEHKVLSDLFRAYLAGNLEVRIGGEEREEPQDAAIRLGNQTVPVEVDIESGVAVMSVTGPIGKHFGSFEAECLDVADLADIDQSAVMLHDDAAVRKVVMYFDTPGGSGLGLVETSKKIRMISDSGKEVVAYTDAQCCSAGYWLAAACDRIVAAPSAMVGSIGTYIAALDDTRRWEMDGVGLKMWRDGDLKGMGHPGKEWTAEEEQFLEDLKEAHSTLFKDWIRERRAGISANSMRGQWFVAQSAPAGLIDGMADSLPELLAELM